MQTATKETVELKQYLTFLLAGEEYALSASIRNLDVKSMARVLQKCPRRPRLRH
jgi:hypothetical protein